MSQALAAFLRCIPQSNQEARSIPELSTALDPALLHGYALLLKTIGILRQDEQGRIQASSQTAKYMLESLASYVESDLALVGDWHTRGVAQNGDPLQNAATLLHALETRRVRLLDDPPAARTEQVAQVLIKRNNPNTQYGELLFQFDDSANQYQLIGGRRKDHEHDLLLTMVREIEEELADNLRFPQHYDLHCVIEDLSPPKIISPTFGALTEYHFRVYHMRGVAQPLQLQPEDVWVPIEQVLAGYVINDEGQPVPFNSGELYGLMDARLPEGLAGLRSSFLTD